VQFCRFNLKFKTGDVRTLILTSQSSSMSQPVAARSSTSHSRLSVFVYLVILLLGLGYVAIHLSSDLSTVTQPSTLPYVLLGLALLIALGFEFVNGFHDTANAVATVIYTNSLPPQLAVVWSGFWNFVGVLTSTGAVAFGIVQLLPIELILQVGGHAGFAMVFSLLIAAVIWNLATWAFGLPSSSSHTLIGSIIGVGVMNQLMHGSSGTSGVDWSQAAGIGRALVFSPLAGFLLSALLLLGLRALVRVPALYKAPEGDKPPPLWIRALLVLTCTGVSFSHGSNDGQKGMGLIMLILIGTVPAAYALNKAVTPAESQAFLATAQQTSVALSNYTNGVLSVNPRADVERFVQTRQLEPTTAAALAGLTDQIAGEVDRAGGSLSSLPTSATGNVRNDMYLASEAIRLIDKTKQIPFTDVDHAVIEQFHHQIDHSTKYIPTWVKVAVSIALGLGTMVGWRRIVVTVGEKVGKEHLTYAQGASAELVAMATISAADAFGLPVSTTHVVTSGVAGTMVANGSGLQRSTVTRLVMAWVLTLPASIALAGALYWVFSAIT
jgi:inorganic phosphate transporter, PiT family